MVGSGSDEIWFLNRDQPQRPRANVVVVVVIIGAREHATPAIAGETVMIAQIFIAW